MRHFLLARELPAVFALCLVGALFAFGNQQSAWGVWLLFAALWCFLFWLILLPRLPHQPCQAAHQPDKCHDDRDDRHHGQRRHTAA